MCFTSQPFQRIARKIFKKGSTTYYYSSLFFPPDIKKDIFTFYAFVRVTDDFVDAIPQDIQGFEHFVSETKKAFKGDPVKNSIISAFYEVAQRKAIDFELVLAFIKAMKADTYKKKYLTFQELEKYMYGSAEVIGLIMCKILKLPKKSYHYAQQQGKAMQLINFIRDISEDTSLGRTYIPAADLKKFNLKNTSPKTKTEKEAFSKLVLFEIERYQSIQKEAEKGYDFIPPHLLIPIKTAANIYNWTAEEIKKDPLIVFERKVKPRPAQVILQSFMNYFTL